MSYAQFQEHFEQAAEAELLEYQQRPAQELLAEIAHGKYGDYYQVWYALQGRTDIEEAGAVLLGVLRSRIDYLVRYHCATLLLSLYNPFPDVLSPVKLSGREKYDVDRNLEEYAQALQTRAESDRK